MVLVILKAVLLKLVLLYVRISLGLGFHEINKIFTSAKKKNSKFYQEISGLTWLYAWEFQKKKKKTWLYAIVLATTITIYCKKKSVAYVAYAMGRHKNPSTVERYIQKQKENENMDLN